MPHAPVQHRRSIDWPRLVPLLLVAATVAAFANGLPGAFVLDDKYAIVNVEDAPHLRQLSPPARKLVINRRALVDVSLAVNYAIHGLWPQGFRVVNIAIHAAAGLALFGLARRTLELPGTPAALRRRALGLAAVIALLWLVHPLQTQSVTYIVQRAESLMGLLFLLALYALLRGAETPPPPAAGRQRPSQGAMAAWLVAAAVASLGALRLAWDFWDVARWTGEPAAWEPLSRAAAALAQRSGLAPAALAWTVTIFGALLATPLWVLLARSWRRHGPAERWLALAALAATLGMATKEVTAVLPLVALLFDRAFLAGSFAAALRRRGRFYAALLATWLVLPALGMHGIVAPAEQEHLTAGFAYAAMTPLEYLRAQAQVILHYLRLAWWPARLTMDYADWPAPQTWGAAAPALAAVGAMLAATLLALWRWPRAGFLAAAFFLVLAPTSSIMPIADLVMEHRMYLPLAALIALLVLGLYGPAAWALAGEAARAAAARLLLGLALAAAVALTARTVLRNHDYRTAIDFYQAEIANRPDNPRAYRNLVEEFGKEGLLEEAVEPLLAYLRLKPDDSDVRARLGMVLIELGRGPEATEHLAICLTEEPDEPALHFHMGRALRQSGEYARAEAHLRAALQVVPDYLDARDQLGLVLLDAGRAPEAIAQFEAVLAQEPYSIDGHNHLGRAYLAQGRLEDAKASFARALSLNRTMPQTFANLGELFALDGQWEVALESYHESLRLRPYQPEVARRIAWIHATAPELPGRDGAEMLALAEAADRATGGREPRFLDTVAATYARLGRFEAAVDTAQRAAAAAQAAGQAELAQQIEARLATYRDRRPHSESTVPAAPSPAPPPPGAER